MPKSEGKHENKLKNTSPKKKDAKSFCNPLP